MTTGAPGSQLSLYPASTSEKLAGK